MLEVGMFQETCFIAGTLTSCLSLQVLHRWDHQQTGWLLRGRQPRRRGPRPSVWQQDGADRGQRQRAEELPGSVGVLMG